MANSTFSGPVRSQNGFETVSINTTTGAVTTNSKGTMVGISHALSKRTNIYALTGSEKNEAVAAVTTAGYKDSKNVIGLRHAF